MLNRLRSLLAWWLMPLEERATVETQLSMYRQLREMLGPEAIWRVLDGSHVVSIVVPDDLRVH